MITMTATYTPDDIRRLIAEDLRHQGYEVDGDVLLNVVEKTEGYGPMEYKRTVFDGASVRIRKGDAEC